MGFKLSELYVDIGGKDSGLASALNRVHDATARTGAAVGSMLSAFKGALVGLASQTGLIATSIKAYASEEASLVKMSAAFRYAGEASAEAVEDFNKWAEALAVQLGVDDDIIRNLGMVGATIGKMTGPALREGALAALQLSEAYGVGADAVMSLIAKLSTGEPLARRSMMALKLLRIEVDSHTTAQEALTKVMARAGEVQDMLASKSETLPGLWARFKIQVGELREALGAPFARIVAAVLTGLRELGSMVTAWIEQNQELIGVLGMVTAATAAFAVAISAMYLALVHPIAMLGALLAALPAVGAYFYVAGQQGETFGEKLSNAFKGLDGDLAAFLTTMQLLPLHTERALKQIELGFYKTIYDIKYYMKILADQAVDVSVGGTASFLVATKGVANAVAQAAKAALSKEQVSGWGDFFDLIATKYKEGLGEIAVDLANLKSYGAAGLKPGGPRYQTKTEVDLIDAIKSLDIQISKQQGTLGAAWLEAIRGSGVFSWIRDLFSGSPRWKELAAPKAPALPAFEAPELSAAVKKPSVQFIPLLDMMNRVQEAWKVQKEAEPAKKTADNTAKQATLQEKANSYLQQLLDTAKQYFPGLEDVMGGLTE